MFGSLSIFENYMGPGGSKERGWSSLRPVRSGVKKSCTNGGRGNNAGRVLGKRDVSPNHLKTLYSGIQKLDKLDRLASWAGINEDSIEDLLFAALVRVQRRKIVLKCPLLKKLEKPVHVETLMAQIYHDIHIASGLEGSCSTEWGFDKLVHEQSVMYGIIEAAVAFHSMPSNSLPAEVSKPVADEEERSIQLATVEEQMSKRFGLFANTFGWMMLSILAHSATFRHSGFTLDADIWSSLCLKIEENLTSLEVFAKVRGLDWQTALNNFSRHFPSDLKAGLKVDIGALNTYVIMEDEQLVRRPKFGDHIQEDIQSNIYNPDFFAQCQIPCHWPKNKDWSKDPTLRCPGDGECRNCNSTTQCNCNPSAEPTPLIELKEYGAKGIGIRALQPIAKSKILGEYVGEILPWYYQGDPVYGMEFCLPGAHPKESVALISSKRYGNWTRFINHSCNSSTAFFGMIIGDRHRIVVKALRDIKAFEEITVHYGHGYWKNGRYCECGEENCAYSREACAGRDIDEMNKY